MRVKSSMMMLLAVGGMLVGVAGLGLVGRAQSPGAGAKEAKPAPDPGKALANELMALADQYTRGENSANSLAKERDRLALQAQSAIIGLKDAQLQMEQAVSAGRLACAKAGKVLDTTGGGWKCEAPKPEPKEIQKK